MSYGENRDHLQTDKDNMVYGQSAKDHMSYGQSPKDYPDYGLSGEPAESSSQQDSAERMGEYEERREAMRLFGALSGVDEKYLEASETSAVKTRIIRWRNLSKGMVAMLCVLVLGASYLGLRGTNLRLKSGGASNSAGPNFASDMSMNLVADSVQTESVAGSPAPAADEECAESENGVDRKAEKDVLSGQQASGGKNSLSGQWVSTGTTAVPTDRTEDKATAEKATQDMASVWKYDAIAEKIQEMTGDKQSAVFQSADDSGREGSYRVLSEGQVAKLPQVGEWYPTEWPKEGRLAALYGRDGEKESYYLLWQYSEEQMGEEGNFFLLVADVLGENLSPTPTAEMAVTGAANLTEDWLGAQMVPGGAEGGNTQKPYGRFGVLCQREDGANVLLRFWGAADTEELWRLLQSMPGLR